MKRALAVCLFAALAACVTVPRANPRDFSSLKEFEAGGLKLKLPSGFKRFAEGNAVMFRPEPPVRPSPGVEVVRDENLAPSMALGRAYDKISTKMGGFPVPIKAKIAGRDVNGLHDQLVTHFIWVYVIPGDKVVWTLEIAVPVEWTDDQAVSFHDMVLANVRLPE